MEWARQTADSARVYDGYLGPAIFQPWAERMVEVVALRPGDRVLDVGCGTGRLALAIAAASETVEVVGVDIAAAQLDVARRRDRGARVRWLEAGAEALPFMNGTYTAVTCQQALQFFDDRAAGVGEIHRVLEPGGRLAVAAWAAIEEQPVHLGLWRIVERHIGERAARMQVPFSLSTKAELTRLLEAAGFSSIEVWSETLEVRFSPADRLGENVLVAGPSGPGFLRLPAETREAILQAVREAFPPDSDNVVTTSMTSNLALASR